MKVPWLPKSGIEPIAGDALSGYEEMTGSPVAPPIPVEDVIERYLNLRIGFMDFDKTYGLHGVPGAIYVKDRLIYAADALLAEHAEGRLNFTFAREAGHWVLHRKFVTNADDSRAQRTAILCRKKDAKKPLEWQADYFAACLPMPEKWIKSAFEESVDIRPLHLHNEQHSLSASTADRMILNLVYSIRLIYPSGDRPQRPPCWHRRHRHRHPSLWPRSHSTARPRKSVCTCRALPPSPDIP
jgi:Zn-dependent peptidase ImmA (M78 family)